MRPVEHDDFSPLNVSAPPPVFAVSSTCTRAGVEAATLSGEDLSFCSPTPNAFPGRVAESLTKPYSAPSCETALGGEGCEKALVCSTPGATPGSCLGVTIPVPADYGSAALPSELRQRCEANLLTQPANDVKPQIAEEWRPCQRFPGYQVSNLGRVIGLKGRPLKPIRHKRTKYIRVKVLGGKAALVHCLVAEAFLGPCPDGFEVDHIDFDRANAKASNLQYLTHRENVARSARAGRMSREGAQGEDSPAARFSNAEVEKIIRRFENGASRAELSLEFGLAVSQVSLLVRGMSWRNIKRAKVATTFQPKVSIETAEEARNLRLSGATYSEIAERIGISRTYAANICLGNGWPHLGRLDVPGAQKPRRLCEHCKGGHRSDICTSPFAPAAQRSLLDHKYRNRKLRPAANDNAARGEQ